MKYFLIAGEASGDLHASNLIKALKRQDGHAGFMFAGGDLMASAANREPVVHYNDMAFMGIWDVIRNIGKIRENFKKIKQSILAFHPDAVILIDYPGFNLRMAKWAKRQGYKVFYYISPKLWAWKENRVEIIRKYVDKLFIILPFEKDFYKKHGINAEYVGNPVKEAVLNYEPLPESEFRQKFSLGDKPLIALLPGSRLAEIKWMLPVMSQLPAGFPDYQFVIAGAPSLTEEIYNRYGSGKIPLIFNATYEILSHAHAAVVTSGTATLETALFNVPQVVGYKTYPLQYFLGKHLVNIRYFSLVNLILNKPAVAELLQQDFNVSRISSELQTILEPPGRQRLRDDYFELNRIIGDKKASDETASKITGILQGRF